MESGFTNNGWICCQNICVQQLPRGRKHKCFWVMKSFARHSKVTLCLRTTTKYDDLDFCEPLHGRQTAKRNVRCTSCVTQSSDKWHVQSRSDRSNQQSLTTKLPKMPRRSGKETQNPLSPLFPLQAQQGPGLFKITAVDKACPAKFSLFECFQNITHGA